MPPRLLDRITIEPGKCGGRPCIRGQRIRVTDALQAASCLQLGGDHLFLTGDGAFKRVAGLNVKVLTAKKEK